MILERMLVSIFCSTLISERPRSLLLPLGEPSKPTPGSYPGPVQVPSRVRGHPGPSWSHPAPERSFQDRAWTGRNRLLGHFRLSFFLGRLWSLYRDAAAKHNQEWPRQTKPKKGQFMNLSQGHSRTKVRYPNRACFPMEKKTPSFTKMGETHGLPGRLLT